MRYKNFIWTKVWLLLLVSIGCNASMGRTFKDLHFKNMEKSIIYFYRVDKYAKVESPSLMINDRKVLSVKNQGYYIFILDPGTYSFSFKWLMTPIKNKKDFSFKAGKTYYIRSWQEPSDYIHTYFPFSSRTPVLESKLSLVEKEEALKTLKNCRLIKPLPESYKQYMVENRHDG